MARILFLFILLSTLPVSGCAQAARIEQGQSTKPKSTPTIAKLSEPPSEWTIKMTHSGGIMGLSRLIEISSNSNFTVMDNRANKTVDGKLAAGELSQLGELLMSIDHRPAGKPDVMTCADCFIYDLEIHTNDRRFAVRLSDITLPNSGYKALIDHLRGMIETALK